MNNGKRQAGFPELGGHDEYPNLISFPAPPPVTDFISQSMFGKPSCQHSRIVSAPVLCIQVMHFPVSRVKVVGVCQQLLETAEYLKASNRSSETTVILRVLRI